MQKAIVDLKILQNKKVFEVLIYVIESNQLGDDWLLLQSLLVGSTYYTSVRAVPFAAFLLMGRLAKIHLGA